MKISILATSACLLLVPHAIAQDEPRLSKDAAGAPASAPATNVANPFELNVPSGGGMGSMMGMDGSMMGDGYGDMGMGSMGYGDMSGGSEPAFSNEQLFRYRLRTAISQISDAENADEKAALLKYTQAALQEQYDAMIARRTKDLNRLQEKLTRLEEDLRKRAAAKDRVVKLQMQSVILAAEGLLDLNSLQSSGNNGYGGEMDMGMGMMGN
ncbi:hypothetical protein [Allorhodopirellula heiligendammensis]|uniref:Uncharacterized protein n=1 Tax=Allorhodopirellula heiligendammensis TaxID=2714739 RepID=A0A5C6BY80_9BACT|nr:hypothetical protein [Allorhodopirellula heiligendammensis]TWU16216.1 hypothetical protein Poly21_34210 [Allorhodopirellula heiligendammensis]